MSTLLALNFDISIPNAARVDLNKAPVPVLSVAHRPFFSCKMNVLVGVFVAFGVLSLLVFSVVVWL